MREGRRIQKKTTVKQATKDATKVKKKKIKIVFIVILAIIILAIVGLIANNYIIFDKNEKTNLVINNNNITSNLKNDVLIEDDIIYLSQDDVANFFDKYIYEEESINKIVTTYDKKIAEIGFEDNSININGSNKSIHAHAIKKDDITYLPISEMTDVYNIEIENLEESKVVTMDSLDREQKQAITTSDLAVKSSTNFIAKTIDRIKKGDNVVIISTEGNYTRIRTSNGKIGYVKSNKLANEFTVRTDMEEEKQIQGKVNLTWDYFSHVATAPDRTGTTIEGVNVVSPAFFYIDEDGEFVENVGEEGQAYIEWAHNNGYKVWPMVSNAGDGMITVTSRIMNSYESRKELIESIVKACVKYGLDGINVDFENMRQEDKDLYSRFIIELTPRLKEIGLVTSVDVTAPDGGETWSLCFDRHVIGDVADYIIFMAYDQYGVSSDKAGTTAGYNWVELSLNKFLTTEEIEPEKIILAVPLYTRLWTEDSNGKIMRNPTVSMKDIDSVIPEGVERNWLDDEKQYYVEYEEDGNTKKMWIEDITSLKEKVALIKNNNLAGVASWQKGMETEEFWKMLVQELELNNTK